MRYKADENLKILIDFKFQTMKFGFSILFLLLCTCGKSVSGFYLLNTFSNETGFTKLDVEIGSYLYISSNDNATLLNEMFIYNGMNMKTAGEIAKLGNNEDGTKTGWKIDSKQIVVQSFNYEPEAVTLTGFIYVPTLEQTQDKNFKIYEVASPITIGKNDGDDFTIVFLNLNLGMTKDPLYVPQMSTNMNIVQGKNSTLKMYWNEPPANWTKPNTQSIDPELFFSNPLVVDRLRFFDSIEPIQVNRKLWYLRGTGEMTLTASPFWVDPNGWTTSNSTTTGLVMSEFAVENLTIYLKNNRNNYGISGFQVTYGLIYPITVSLEAGVYLKTHRTGDVTVDQESLMVNLPSDWIKVNSPYQIVGIYGVQYYAIEGDPLPYTVTPRLSSAGTGTTPNGIETSTKLSSKLTHSYALFSFAVLWLIFY